jgi:hypothetical protein
MSNIYSPILLFTYKRLDTLKKTVASLAENELANQSELFIFSDGAKIPSDDIIVAQVREFLKTVKGFKKITIYESNRNKGLATSIIDGVTLILQSFDTVIVLEDDLGTTPNFLTFMNSCLDNFKAHRDAFSVSGYSFNLGISTDFQEDAYFLNRGWSWGWGTWKDRWENVDWDVKDYDLFKNDATARKRFSKGGSDLNKMLDMQMNGQLDSWAIRWFYHQFKINGLTIYPVFSKVFNNGFDNLATHTNGSITRYLPLLDNEFKNEFKFPEKVILSQDYQHRFLSKMGIWSRLKSKLETVIIRIFK